MYLTDVDNRNSDAISTDHLYTPAMLAELLHVSVRIIRRWQRSGLLTPTTKIMELPYFDYAELTTAKALARWMQQGVSVQSIEQQLAAFRTRLGAVSVPVRELIQQLPISVDGKSLVLRHGESHIESSGQFRLEFEVETEPDSEQESPATIQFREPSSAAAPGRLGVAGRPAKGAPAVAEEAMIEQAILAEDDGDLETAVDWYRSALAAYGPKADTCFQVAELLYRQGDLCGARERYFTALELNPDLVEARANLGCVLAECGQADLAVAAFEGALEQYADYADVHFHLARALDDSGHAIQAAEHWMRFLELAPDSPWADEAKQRIQATAPMLDM
ncbi:MerR family transcriptional regulator [Aureliella helgolandensis]|uniref:Photosystem I assembly protein Ycf3 n=1 Tax=Aureliella helgolandensis TaxID=2527968 RepID=A0A518G053_9BACT|nr:MerR family transcriptional regulator [Aureliella helgolandensis]QDV21979.1 Photosystem I assembly protein Ycf3 [Aureliella helgolandensis]